MDFVRSQIGDGRTHMPLLEPAPGELTHIVAVGELAQASYQNP